MQSCSPTSMYRPCKAANKVQAPPALHASICKDVARSREGNTCSLCLDQHVLVGYSSPATWVNKGCSMSMTVVDVRQEDYISAGCYQSTCHQRPHQLRLANERLD